MAEFDDRVTLVEDWMIPSPSPRTLFSSLVDDIAPKPNSESMSAGDKNTVPRFSGPEVEGASGSAVEKDAIRASVVTGEISSLSSYSQPKMSSCGGLMERMVARAGFHSLRLNTESIIPCYDSKNTESTSPCLTIPPGLSPTTLLDSPVFLSNPLVLPSPTTGKFLFAPSGSNRTSLWITNNLDKGKDSTFKDVCASSFEFKTNAESRESSPYLYFNASNEVNPSSFSPQPFPSVRDSVHTGNSSYNAEPTIFFNNDDQSPPLDELHEDVEDQRTIEDLNTVSSPSEDGYNWRKYGQKHVKGSEYPRSYYKCTHSNCPVKKKVERSQEGHITEIIYKGGHNHAKPLPNRRSALGTSSAPGDMEFKAEQSLTGAKNDHIWPSVQNTNPDWRQDELEATSTAPLSQEYIHQTSVFHVPSGTHFESGDGAVGNSTFSNDDDENDRVTQGSASLGYDGEGDESESKRRKIEAYAPEMSGSSRAIREPRVVVQTTSDVDILDDGYRWRKYGQKVVKGNPNPRSYYKCTSTGCNVRKHVERASHDLKSVITTYEGKHNHDVPAARNSSHANSSSSNIIPTQQASAAASSHKRNPEPCQNQSSSAPFEMPPLGSFGFTSRPILGPPTGYLLGMNQPRLAFGPNQGRLPAIPVHPYSGHEQNQVCINTGSMLTKTKLKPEPITDSGLNSSNDSVYQQFISRLPPRPHIDS